MLTISVWPRRLKEFLLTHPLYKSPIGERGLPILVVTDKLKAAHFLSVPALTSIGTASPSIWITKSISDSARSAR